MTFSTSTWIGLGLLGAVGAYLWFEKRASSPATPLPSASSPIGSKPIAKKGTPSMPSVTPSSPGSSSTTPPAEDGATIEEYAVPKETSKEPDYEAIAKSAAEEAGKSVKPEGGFYEDPLFGLDPTSPFTSGLRHGNPGWWSNLPRIRRTR